MQLWLVPAFSGCVHECQGFREHRETCLWLSHDSMGFGEERQTIWLVEHCSGGTKGAQSLGDLCNPVLCLSLLGYFPAVQYRSRRLPQGKSLGYGKTDSGCGTLVGSTPLPE